MDLDISLLTPRLSSIREAQSPDNEGSQIADNCPPTQPATPIVPSERAKFRAKFKVRLDIPSSPSSPVPILAPPPYDQIPRAPMNQEEVAEARLVAMLGRELEERTADGFLASDFVFQSVAPAHADESISESDEEMDEDERQVCQAIVSRKSSIESGGLVSETDVFVWPQQPRICIDEDFRQEVMEWILDVSASVSVSFLVVLLTHCTASGRPTRVSLKAKCRQAPTRPVDNVTRYQMARCSAIQPIPHPD